MIIGLGLIGLILGVWAGAAYLVPKGAGLAGGPMVLMYGIIGFVGFGIAGAIITFRMQAKRLRNSALIIGILVLLLYLILAAIAFKKAVSEREPDSAFVPAGEFIITMERVDRSDPYLFVKMHVDSNTRTWAQTGPAPEHKICSARLKANNLVEIRKALDKLLALSHEKLADCDSADQPVVKRLHWNLIDAQSSQANLSLPHKGTLDVNSNCLRQHSEIARTFSLVETISQYQGGKVTCN